MEDTKLSRPGWLVLASFHPQDASTLLHLEACSLWRAYPDIELAQQTVRLDSGRSADRGTIFGKRRVDLQDDESKEGGFRWDSVRTASALLPSSCRRLAGGPRAGPALQRW